MLNNDFSLHLKIILSFTIRNKPALSEVVSHYYKMCDLNDLSVGVLYLKNYKKNMKI